METEHVFKALADHHRRHLLDSLSQTGGQTLSELCAQLPMSRFGAMKHLRILEEADLVTTRKVGRVKLHYLEQFNLHALQPAAASNAMNTPSHSHVRKRRDGFGSSALLANRSACTSVLHNG
ncbi:MAG: helix-turn-helix domain-containing protein, partial [Chloroflexota bacterium]